MSVSDEHADDGHGEHHLPATEDWPHGFGEASWWPFVTAIGGSGIYVSAALLVLSMGENALVSQTVGAGAMAGSVGLFLVGIYGWLYHAFVSDFWERGTDYHSDKTLKFAMLLFLGSEIATFGAGFVYYFIVRGGEVWTQAAVPEVFGSLVIVNTLLLIASSVTLHYSHIALRSGNRSRFLKLLGATLLLGIVFIGGQVYEYYEFIVHKGFSIGGGIYGSAFYGLTGLHGLHVTMGAVLLGIVFIRGYYGQYSAERHTSVSTASMYWHFVDIVWIFLVVVLYMGANLV
ncbi:cytochrome c oxidase subunit 3 [Haloarcula quadrata]|jgi:cytochrome c oxidase subunit 3|uniref:Cytochrome c oxidase polypeptide III n=4 Tax=Haloarcula TaxID=2237 RepID=Q5V2C4_HALMA|nr:MULTISPECIES: cytochrome c oxidase subunit 3 [Haloarcula]AAV46327.1 cytochrome c oxidase polypeptide III [Haloarcula marismortui ATCC 43049]EMA16253.1 cytochrome c oxidase polypeptide III [Haloarcula sinaiiensis ATCC 33800]EMA26665.1 cytochrome c oxidase polypeptide III [Haloarcula californiae ATCC 33799]NHN65469.1 heme-copper oxidase subunit III [Haloarcula sp. JP-Z28]QCP91062.1 heme-copper oxidase subunit III [Haloarcula marismortui ATCC 43049]